MKSLIKRLIARFVVYFKYNYKFSPFEYGYIRGTRARRNKKTGVCGFVLWKKGDQSYVDGIGHTEDKWVRFGDGHEIYFIPNEMAKKQRIPDSAVKVYCLDCVHCPNESAPEHLVDCSNKDRNPQGYKIGCWAHYCPYYKARANAKA